MGLRILWYGFADPGPHQYQNVTDPEHYRKILRNCFAAVGGQQRTGTGLLKESKIGYATKNNKKKS